MRYINMLYNKCYEICNNIYYILYTMYSMLYTMIYNMLYSINKQYQLYPHTATTKQHTIPCYNMQQYIQYIVYYILMLYNIQQQHAMLYIISCIQHTIIIIIAYNNMQYNLYNMQQQQHTIIIITIHNTPTQYNINSIESPTTIT